MDEKILKSDFVTFVFSSKNFLTFFISGQVYVSCRMNKNKHPLSGKSISIEAKSVSMISIYLCNFLGLCLL
jgi:hypothetical protein